MLTVAHINKPSRNGGAENSELNGGIVKCWIQTMTLIYVGRTPADTGGKEIRSNEYKDKLDK